MDSFVVNRFDKSFGPVGSSAGLFLLIGGFILLYYSYSSLFLIIFGALLAFTNSSTTIDYKNKRVRFCNNICGLFKFGKWTDVQSDMFIRIENNRIVQRAYSRSNRSLDIKTHHYKVLLCNNKKEIIPLLHANSYTESIKAAEEIARKFQIEIIN